MLSACDLSGGRQLAATDGRDQAAETSDAPKGRWLTGDMHVHTDHSSDGSATRQGLDHRGPANVSVADQIGEAERQGLQWLPLTDHRTYTQHYDPLWESDQLLLIPGEEANGKPHANPLGAVDTIVQGGVPEGRPDWSRLQTSIWDAHAQGAVWSHNHPDDGHLNDDGSLNGRASAVGADLMEIWNKGSDIDLELAYAETRWNRGFRFAGVGASDNHFRELWKVAGPGTPATHVFAPALSERGILDGLRAGRVSINLRHELTPFLTLEADFDGAPGFEALAGDEIIAPAGREGTLRVMVTNGLGGTLMIFGAPGRAAGALHSVALTGLSQTEEFPVTTNGEQQWFYAEVRGPGEIDSLSFDALQDNPVGVVLDPSLGRDERRAITAPIFIGPEPAVARGEERLPADIGKDDGARAVLDGDGIFHGFPDVAVAGSTTHVVAERHSVAGTHVVYRRLAGASPAIVLAPESQTARFPKIAAQGDDVWVVWQDERDGQIPRRPAIMLRHSSDGGVSWHPPQRIRGLAGRAEKPDLALLPDGRPVVVWQEIAADRAFDVMLWIAGEGDTPVNLSADGKTTQAYNGIDTRSALYPASVWPKVAAAANGTLAVAFQDNRLDPDPLWTSNFLTGEDGATEVDNFDIAVTVRRPGGAWSALQLLGDDQRFDAHPDLAFDPSGRLVLAWDSKEMRASGANLSIRYATSLDGGQTWSSPDAPPALAESVEHMSQYPRLGVGPDGRVQAVWYDNRAVDWRWRVMTARWQGDGWGAASMLMAPGVNTWPAVADGHIVLASTRQARRLQRDRTQGIFLLSPGN